MSAYHELKKIFNVKEIVLPDYIKVLLELQKNFNLPQHDTVSLINELKTEGELYDKMRNFVLDKIKEKLFKCDHCHLHNSQSATRKVPAEGSLMSPIMLIGEGPGADEDRLGRPFVGKAGQLLSSILTKLGVKREKIYISNIIKCRPPNNRTPLANEVQACSRNLELELSLVSPKVILVLGSVPLRYFKPSGSIMSSRGHWINERGIWIMPTYHPAYILRQQGKALNKVKWQVWGDFNEAMNKAKQLCPQYRFG